MATLVLIVVPDLIFRAKILETARQVGRACESATTAAAALEKAASLRPALVIVDLGDDRVAPLEIVRALKDDPRYGAPRAIGFFSHVLVDLRRSAKAAGYDRALPRSAFVAQLPELLETLGEAPARSAG